MYLKG